MKLRTIAFLLLLFTSACDPNYYHRDRQDYERHEERREHDDRRAPTGQDRDDIDRRPSGYR
jgi:uncharacterized lipoprotein